MNSFIHNTAIVETKKFGKNNKVWHFTHICKDANIGSNCNIGQNVFISNKVKIGNFCKIQNNVSIFDNITLEDYVFCGPSVVFTNVINPRSEFERKNQYKKTLIKKGVSLGANATILCGNTIGKYAFVGAGSVVTTNIKNYALYVGNPAKQIAWFSRYGEKISLDLDGEKFFKCQFTKDKYILKNGNLILV